MLRHKRTSSGGARYIDAADYALAVHEARARQSHDLRWLIGRYLDELEAEGIRTLSVSARRVFSCPCKGTIFKGRKGISYGEAKEGS